MFSFEQKNSVWINTVHQELNFLSPISVFFQLHFTQVHPFILTTTCPAAHQTALTKRPKKTWWHKHSHTWNTEPSSIQKRGKAAQRGLFRSWSVWIPPRRSWSQSASCPPCGARPSPSWPSPNFSSSSCLQAPSGQTALLSWSGQCRCRNKPWQQRWRTLTAAGRRRGCTRPTGKHKTHC